MDRIQRSTNSVVHKGAPKRLHASANGYWDAKILAYAQYSAEESLSASPPLWFLPLRFYFYFYFSCMTIWNASEELQVLPERIYAIRSARTSELSSFLFPLSASDTHSFLPHCFPAIASRLTSLFASTVIRTVALLSSAFSRYYLPCCASLRCYHPPKWADITRAYAIWRLLAAICNTAPGITPIALRR
jgi:hypothetical protein